MCPKKLSESDKKEILELYRNTPETTSTLALRYDVSSSTVSRLLKKNLSDQEYEDLIQEKRLGRTQKPIEQLALSLPDSEGDDQELMESQLLSEQEIADRISAYSSILEEEQINLKEPLEDKPIISEITPIDEGFTEEEETQFEEEENKELINDFEEESSEDFETNSSLIRRRKRRSSSVVSEAFAEEILAENNRKNAQAQLIEINQNQLIESSQSLDLDEDDLEDDSAMSHETVLALQEFLGEELEDPDDELDDEELDDEELDEQEEIESIKIKNKLNFGGIKQGTLSIFPLEKASFPRTCYIVVDRASELITRPLQDFRELGLIPPEEFAQKTLPIFENHRVARRFSKRKERVIKIPDGKMLKKTCPHLASKGITRLILDGQVYSLNN